MKRAVLVLLVSGCVAQGDAQQGVAGGGLGDETGDGGGKEDGAGFTDRVCADGPTVLGVDVSYYQGVIDWSRVAGAGVGFAFVRVSDGEVFRDPKFAANWQGALDAGLVRGAYQYFRPTQDIDTQAQLMIDAIGTYRPGDLPPVLDVESTGGLRAATLATRVNAWLDRVEAALGVRPVVYSGSYFWRDQVGGADQTRSALWIAQYSSHCPYLPLPWQRWDFWQYSANGRVAGIKGPVDMDRFNGSLEALRAFARTP